MPDICQNLSVCTSVCVLSGFLHMSGYYLGSFTNLCIQRKFETQSLLIYFIDVCHVRLKSAYKPFQTVNTGL